MINVSYARMYDIFAALEREYPARERTEHMNFIHARCEYKLLDYILEFESEKWEILFRLKYSEYL